MGMTGFDFDYLRKFVYSHSAIVLDETKSYLAESRLAPVAYREGFASLQELMQEMRSRSFNGLHRRVLEAMTNNETWFFRDLGPFEALRTQVIPALMTARASERRINIWSAACSSGQEPYSIAILLREHFPQLRGWDVHIYATDISEAILNRAKAGRYTQLEMNRGLPATLLSKYFSRDGLEWQLRPDVKQMVDFRSINLADRWPELPMADILFLRNVLIYFEVDIKKQVLQKARRALRGDGAMFLGGAESTMNLSTEFDRVPFEKTAYYRPC